ncbi:MAG: hypothetical protein OEW35_13465 [Gammaproteobacteria bacterium]|nr:hypothetical protein [Gammaproteobacteria bacterium]MDH5311842.1 hypothetical protein [Gammaproteobacteria bacterium]
MKYVISLLLGVVTGTALFMAMLYFNPFAGRIEVSPLAVSDQEQLVLRYEAVAQQMLLYTNDGESLVAPHPVKVEEIWEPTVRDSWVQVVELSNASGTPLGVGVKFSSESEATRPLNAQALVDSIWHIYLPGRGTLFVEQRENYWAYIRDIVIPARVSSADSWRGSWIGITTAGPNQIGTGRVWGGSGEFAGSQSESVETLQVTAYSAVNGPAAMTGSLTVSLPSQTPENGNDEVELD